MSKKERKQRKKQKAILADGLEKRLKAYALAAGTAGAVLAGSGVADASIVQLPTLQISQAGSRFMIGPSLTCGGPNCSYIPNGNFFQQIHRTASYAGLRLQARGSASVSNVRGQFSPFSRLAGRTFVGAGVDFQGNVLRSSNTASAFRFFGQDIGPGSLNFQKSTRLNLASGFGTRRFAAGGLYQGAQSFATTGHIGYLAFDLPGSHFAWGKLNAHASAARGSSKKFPTAFVSASLTLYEESCAAQPIMVGQTSGGANCTAPPPTPIPEPPTATLSLLAIGAAGLAFWRRKKQTAAAEGN